jgi:hypothetical protein
MSRFMADCRRWPSETNCSLVIIGEEDEVVAPRQSTPPRARARGHAELREAAPQLPRTGRGVPLGRGHKSRFPDRRLFARSERGRPHRGGRSPDSAIVGDRRK